MERQVKFRDSYEVTADDLNNVEAWSQDSTDHVVADTIEPGRRYQGFAVSQTSTTAVSVAAGRLYFDGKRYFTDADTALDLNGNRPATQQRIVSIVAWPETIDTDIQERDFELDATTQTYEPRPVPMESRRNARLEGVAGAEGVSPQAPVIDASAVVIANVLMGPAGIVSVTMNADALVPNLRATADDVADLKSFRDDVEPQVSTLKSDMAKLAEKADNQADKKLLFDTASDMAIVKAALGMPATYVGYRGNAFLDNAVDEQTAAAGYSCRIAEGLRFPMAATQDQALALFNPYTPDVMVSAGSLVLPTYTNLERRITKGQAGEVALAQYAYENRSLLNITMSRSRVRFGGDFEVSTNSAFWASGTYTDRLNGGTRATFQRNGENFQVYDTGEVDADGHKIVRLAQYWNDTVTTPYWSRLSTAQNLLGYAHVETFLNAQDAWIVALGPHMTRKPAAGTITFGICATDRGEPDFDNILAMTTLQAADVKLVSSTGDFPQTPIEPTFLEGGKRYGYFVVTAGDFYMGVTDAANEATGTYFYGTNGGVWNANPGAHLIWRDWRASFTNPTVNVDLQPLNLVGGIQSIDVLCDSVIPASCDLVWSVQIGGVWETFDPTSVDMLTSLPSNLPMRASFVGTKDVMPGFKLNNSQVEFGRLATAAKRVSKQRALAAGATTVTLKTRMRNWDAAHHTIANTITKADNSVVTPTTTTSTVMPDGVTERVATFNLGAATTAYTVTTTMGTDSALRPFTVSEQIEIAQ